MLKLLRVLIVAGSDAEAEPLVAALRRGGVEPEWERIPTWEALSPASRQVTHDIVLVNYHHLNLPVALQALADCRMPVIVVAGMILPATAAALVKAGVSDFVPVDDLADLVSVVERALQEFRQRSSQPEDDDRTGAQRYRQLCETIPTAVWEQDWSRLNTAIDALKVEGVADFSGYLDEHPAFVEQALDMIETVDANPAALAICGIRRKEELHGLPFNLDNLPTWHAVLTAVAKGRAGFNGETTLYTVQGGTFHIGISLAIPKHAATFERVLIYGTDVTAYRAAEVALTAAQRNFYNIVTNNPLGILITNRDGVVQFANAAAQALLGRGAKELQGASFGVPVLVGQVTEIDIIQPGQAARVAELSVTTTAWEGETACLAMLNDVTERKREEEKRKKAEEEIQRHKEILEEAVRERTAELRLAKEAAEAANRAKSSFMANISHEVRTPLHSIISFARLGMRKNTILVPEKRFHYFQKINESGEMLLALLNDLLDLAKLESGKAFYDFELTDLGTLTLSAIDEFRPLAAERSLTLHFNRPVQRVNVILDKTKIMQVLRNLLSNAVKFSPEGGNIDVSMYPLEQSVVVSLRDQGPGIPENELKVIFDKFVQSSKTKTGAGGTGLGLPICHEIVAAHKGRIWAESNPGGGALFLVEIPLDPTIGNKPFASALMTPEQPDGIQ